MTGGQRWLFWLATFPIAWAWFTLHILALVLGAMGMALQQPAALLASVGPRINKWYGERLP